MKPEIYPTSQTALLPAPSEPARDHQLIRNLANGDRHACREILQRHQNRLFGIAFAILHSREEAEDTVQEVTAQMWRKAAAFDPARGQVGTWLTTLTRNRAIDRLRQLQRRARLNDAYEVQTRRTLPPRTEPVPSPGVLLRDEGEALRRALALLAQGQRQAIELAFFEELTQQEVARRLGVPLGTIKARIRRGLQKLSRLVAPTLGRN